MHTPGPWTVDSRTLAIYAPDRHGHAAAVRVAECGRTLLPAAEIAANAALVAAAPKMLDDLRSIAYVTPKDHNGKISYKNAYESMVRVALGAISAATGGQ